MQQWAFLPFVHNEKRPLRVYERIHENVLSSTKSTSMSTTMRCLEHRYFQTRSPITYSTGMVLHHNTHYSKSQIFVQKFNFYQNPNIFTSFSPRFFLTIFLVKPKLSTAKKSKTTTFSRVFHPKKNRQFSREIKVEFLDKK